MSRSSYFSKILVANRGEIAIRIMRSCRDMGISTVAVYSDIDRSALHVQYADEAFNIGGNTARESYLVMDRILEIAKKSKAEAIHPGYGFLAENPDFSRKCSEEGIVFIGPEADAIERMGQKIVARQLMKNANVPLIPGTVEPLSGNTDEALEIAREIGFPIMIKASAGGGGKGMRVVNDADGFLSALRAAQSEASSSFGDNTVYLEKYISSPHHIEFQILADNYGNTVSLFERECSVQRRHQKVIEECPSPFLNDELRSKMGQAAVMAAKAVNYRNAGTVEFIVDADRSYYFLEMNTRLQVEHPVTELVTGKDLVRLQIMIAGGEKLPFEQEELRMHGSAIECRIYAEDPDNNFIPSPGKIINLKTPSGPGVRDDSGVYEGYEIPIYYDPLISKLCAWGETREFAIDTMLRALSEYRVSGVKTNLRLHSDILNHPEFKEGIYDTGFIEKNINSVPRKDPEGTQNIAIAAAAVYQHLKKTGNNNGANSAHNTASQSRWKSFGRQRALTSRLR